MMCLCIDNTCYYIHRECKLHQYLNKQKRGASSILKSDKFMYKMCNVLDCFLSKFNTTGTALLNLCEAFLFVQRSRNSINF